MARKSGLGKGLEALIPASANAIYSQTGDESRAGGVTQVETGLIQPNPRQPRSRFDPQELDELAASIREHGVLHPLLVTQSKEGGQYTLIAGERRLLAARIAKLATVPVIIREISEQNRIELALIENVQRADLSPLETAQAYHQLVDEFHLSHEQIAEKVGKNRVSVTNTLRLLKLPASIQQSLASKQITEGHARVLLSLSTVQAQVAALQTIIKNDLNVRQTEELVRKMSGQKPTPSPRKSLPPELAAVEERLQEGLGTKVRLNHRQNAGTLIIHYYSDEELDALVNRILRDS